MTTTLLILPTDDAVQAALYRLSETERTAGDLAGMKATDKAAAQFARGARPLVSCDTYLVESRTDAGSVYRVRREGGVLGCNCQAGLNGRQCWHVALIHAIDLAWEIASLSDDSSFIPDDTPSDDFDDVPAGPGEPRASVAGLVARISAARARAVAA